MKIFLILTGTFVVAWSRPQYSYHQPRYQPHIIRYDYNNAGLGEYSFGVETSDGFRHDQAGEIKNIGTEHEGLSVTGSYSYIGPDGITYTVHYIADENGFQPQGEHLPASAGVKKLGICSAAQASLCGGGLG